MMLRNRKWTGYSRKESVIRVDYADASQNKDNSENTGKMPVPRGVSFIEIDIAKKSYRVQVEGRLIAQDFVTVAPGMHEGTLVAYSRADHELDWPAAPAGWSDGPLDAVTLTESGPGIRPSAKIENGRIKLSLKAEQPVRLSRK